MRISAQAQSELDQLLEAYPQPGLSGTVAALVSRDGKELYLGASGVNDVETGERMRTDTVSRCGCEVASSSSSLVKGLSHLLVHQGDHGDCMHASCRTGYLEAG